MKKTPAYRQIMTLQRPTPLCHFRPDLNLDLHNFVRKNAELVHVTSFST